MQCRQPHTMLCTPHPQFPGNLATRKASTSHAIHIWYASCFINHSFHMTILNIWAECLQGEETCQDLKVIDVVLDSSSDHCPPSWCGINNPSPASKGCVWINCDLGLPWVTVFDVFVILIQHGRSDLTLSEKFMKESKLPFFVSEQPLFLFQVVCNKGAHPLYPRKTCNHKVNHFRDSPYSEGLVVKQVNYFWH